MSGKTRIVGLVKTDILQAQTLPDIIILSFLNPIRKTKKAFDISL
jgi:hypothetical protein